MINYGTGYFNDGTFQRSDKPVGDVVCSMLRILQHSARKQGGLILQLLSPHGAFVSFVSGHLSDVKDTFWIDLLISNPPNPRKAGWRCIPTYQGINRQRLQATERWADS